MRSCARSARMLITHQRLLEWNPSGDQERASRSDLSASFRAMWFAPALAVGTAGALAVFNPAALFVAGPFLILWLAIARHRLVDQPARRAPRGPADGRANPFSRPHRAQDLGVLRALRRPGRPLAAAGQLPGIPRRRTGASHLADQHGTGAAGEPVRLRLRLPPRRVAAGAHGAHPGDDGRNWNATGAISTTGTTRRRCNLCAPRTSRRWTAATWRAIC